MTWWWRQAAAAAPPTVATHLLHLDRQDRPIHHRLSLLSPRWQLGGRSQQRDAQAEHLPPAGSSCRSLLLAI